MSQKATARNLEILNHSMKKDEFGTVTIEGQVKNVSKRTFTTTQVNVKLYDAKGKLITIYEI